ncbi:hypothetical protein D3C76_1867460 [compost metagenome]
MNSEWGFWGSVELTSLTSFGVVSNKQRFAAMIIEADRLINTKERSVKALAG